MILQLKNDLCKLMNINFCNNFSCKCYFFLKIWNIQKYSSKKKGRSMITINFILFCAVVYLFLFVIPTLYEKKNAWFYSKNLANLPSSAMRASFCFSEFISISSIFSETHKSTSNFSNKT